MRNWKERGKESVTEVTGREGERGEDDQGSEKGMQQGKEAKEAKEKGSRTEGKERVEANGEANREANREANGDAFQLVQIKTSLSLCSSPVTARAQTFCVLCVQLVLH